MESVRPVIDQKRCTSCGACVQACRFEVLKLRKGGAEARGIGTCIACGACVAVCPVGAVEHPLMPAERIVALPAQAPVGYPELLDLLRRRRSIRRYADEPVPEPVLHELVEAAILAPSAHNSQPWQFTFVTDAAVLAEIRDAYAQFFRALLAQAEREAGREELAAAHGESLPPLLDALGGALHLLVRAHDRGDDRLLWGAPVLALVHSAPEAPAAALSCTCAAANMMLAATALGLGSCIIGFLTIPMLIDPGFVSVLGLPQSHRLHVGMAVGRPALRLRRSVVRREPPVTII
ncbi:MAG: nitroreductase family protein [Armatimonadota bacterium]